MITAEKTGQRCAFVVILRLDNAYLTACRQYTYYSVIFFCSYFLSSESVHTVDCNFGLDVKYSVSDIQLRECTGLQQNLYQLRMFIFSRYRSPVDFSSLQLV